MFDRKDSTARNMAVSAIVWLVLASRSVSSRRSSSSRRTSCRGIAWLVFPRIRQAHVNGLAFGWLSMAMVGGLVLHRAAADQDQDLLRDARRSSSRGRGTSRSRSGVIGLFMGWTQAREYAELAWPIDIAIMVVLAADGLQPVHDDRARARRRTST